MSQTKRVLIIGIDGATFDLIDPLIADDKLPTLQKIISQGTHGILNSVLPPHSATGWTSLFTGKNSGKHDIYDFYNRFNGTYERNIIKSHDIKSKTIWQILGEHNLKSILVNIPITYPPSPVNGIIVSGMLTPPGQKFTYPEQLSDELYQKDYIIDIFYHFRETLDDYIKLAHKTITKRQQIFLDLLSKNDWDFATVVFTTPDRLQHTIWQHQSHIQELYIKLDSLIGQILDEIMDDNTYLMIVSDYGFKSVTKKFFVNEWLWELGLLSKEISTLKASIPNFIEDQFGHQNNQNKFITKFLTKSGITKDNIRSIVPDLICELMKKVTPTPLRKIFPKENLIINWDKTKAYFSSPFSQGININLKGREPQGIVNPGREYEQLRDLIIRELYRLKDPHTFENIIDEVYKGEDIYFGEYFAHAPDIIFVPRNYDYVLEPNKRTNRQCISHANDDYPVFAGHDPKGIFLTTGPSIKRKAKIVNANILDIAPTILTILDVPIPKDLDGKVMYRVFENNGYQFLENNNEVDSDNNSNSIFKGDRIGHNKDLAIDGLIL